MMARAHGFRTASGSGSSREESRSSTVPLAGGAEQVVAGAAVATAPEEAAGVATTEAGAKAAVWEVVEEAKEVQALAAALAALEA